MTIPGHTVCKIQVRTILMIDVELHQTHLIAHEPLAGIVIASDALPQACRCHRALALMWLLAIRCALASPAQYRNTHTPTYIHTCALMDTRTIVSTFR